MAVVPGQIRQPPSSVTGELRGWLSDVAAVLNNTPQMSYFSGVTPESVLTGRVGNLAVNLVSGTSDVRLYLKGGDPVNPPTKTGWVAMTPGSVAAGFVTSVSGTAGRITVGGTATAPVVDISSLYSGQSTITTIGTLIAGAVPASLVTAGTFGAGDYVFPSDLTVTDTLKINGGVSGSSAQLQAVGGSNFRTYATQVNHLLGRANGALGSETVLVNNDAIGGLTWQGYDGTTVSTGATLLGIARGTWSGSSRPTAIRFATTASGSTTTTGRWDVDPSGHFIGVADNTYDIGASGATRPRTGYFGTSVVVGTDPTGSQMLRVGGDGVFQQPSGTATGLRLQSLHDTAASASQLQLRRARTGPAAVQSGDVLGYLTGLGYDSSAYVTGSEIRFVAAETFSGTARGTTLRFYTTLVTTTTLTEQWRITSSGVWQPGTDNANDIGLTGTRPKTVYGYTLDATTRVTSPLLGTTTAVDTVIDRNSVATITAGATAVTLGVNNLTNGNADFVFQRNAVTKLTLATAAVTLALPIRFKNYTVATLPAGTQGDTAFVTDALAPAFLTAVVGGGAIVTPVFFDGTNWVAY